MTVTEGKLNESWVKLKRWQYVQRFFSFYRRLCTHPLRLSMVIRSDNRFIQGDLVNKWIMSSHIGQLKFDKKNSLIKDVRQKRTGEAESVGKQIRSKTNIRYTDDEGLTNTNAERIHFKGESIVELETTVKQLNTWSIDEISTKYKAKGWRKREREKKKMSCFCLGQVFDVERRRRRSNDEWLYLHSIKAQFFFRVNHRFK